MRDEVRTREVKLRKLIEELRIATETAVHSEERLRGILESAMDAIITVDESQRIVLFNVAAEGIFGCTRDEAVGAPLARFIPERFLCTHANHIEDFGRQGTPARPMGRDRIVVALRRNGEEFPIDASISQISEAGSKYYTVILRDVTERVRAHAALERTILDLRQFAYAASHDLRTPLRAISGFAQLLQKKYVGVFDEEAGHWIARVVSGAQRMERLIEDLLSYARLESQERHFVPVDCRAVFDDAIQLLESDIRDTGAEVTTSALPTIMGDQGQLVQLLQNLIGNGIKFHAALPPRVHVSARRKDGALVISVSDNGVGIEPEQHQRIFEIFRRLHTQSEYPGTGIGLAVCRRIVERHGGTLWVESAPGQGSTFLFAIPDRNEVTS
jgi:PAS domain S-box-containing protein